MILMHVCPAPHPRWTPSSSATTASNHTGSNHSLCPFIRPAYLHFLFPSVMIRKMYLTAFYQTQVDPNAINSLNNYDIVSVVAGGCGLC